MKLAGVDGHRWGLFRRMDISDPVTGDLYLRRFRLVETPWFGVKVHHIVAPDPGRDIHNHPWWFVSLILWGGYIEQTRHIDPLGEYGSPFRARRPRRWHYMSAAGLHRITHLPKGHAWTLVVNGPRVQEWGFSRGPGQWVDWRTYLAGPDAP